jgi:hypothetical protein
MTEDEAKTKWCPLAQISFKSDEIQVCAASNCMMWRWEVTNPDYVGPEGKYHDQGYCGVGGGE